MKHSSLKTWLTDTGTHVGSQCYHLAEVTFPPLPQQIKVGATKEKCKAELT